MNFSQKQSLTGPFLADVGQIVVAGHVVPFAVLSGDHHHTILSAREEVIRLILTPVLIHLREEQTNDYKRGNLESE